MENNRAYQRQWYYKNKEVHKKAARAKKLRNREYLHKLKDKPCSDCKNKYPPHVMQFDHTDSNKVCNVSKLVSYSIKRIKEEAEKCDVVCANCHAERTHKRRQASVV